MAKTTHMTLTKDFDKGGYCNDLHSLKLTAKAPENRPSQKEINLSTIDFQVLC